MQPVPFVTYFNLLATLFLTLTFSLFPPALALPLFFALIIFFSRSFCANVIRCLSHRIWRGVASGNLSYSAWRDSIDDPWVATHIDAAARLGLELLRVTSKCVARICHEKVAARQFCEVILRELVLFSGIIIFTTFSVIIFPHLLFIEIILEKNVLYFNIMRWIIS